jgi:hypothetical protein
MSKQRVAKIRAAANQALEEETLAFASQSRVATTHVLQPGPSGQFVTTTSHCLPQKAPLPQLPTNPLPPNL